MGCFFGIFDTATVSFAQIELNDPVFASLILAIESLVSTIVGFVFGMILITARQSKKMLAFSIVIGLGYGSMIFVSSSVSLLVVIFVAAGAYAPFVITLNETAERAVPEANITEALTWVTSAASAALHSGRRSPASSSTRGDRSRASARAPSLRSPFQCWPFLPIP